MYARFNDKDSLLVLSARLVLRAGCRHDRSARSTRCGWEGNSIGEILFQRDALSCVHVYHHKRGLIRIILSRGSTDHQFAERAGARRARSRKS